MNEILFFIIFTAAVSIALTATLLFIYDYVWVRWVTNTEVDKGVFERLFDGLHCDFLHEGLMTEFDDPAEALMLLMFSIAVLALLVFFMALLGAVGLLPWVAAPVLFFVGAKVYYSKYKA